MHVYTTPRPYHMTATTGHVYTLSSVEVDRLLAAYPVVTATPNRVELRGDSGNVCRITPATLGGGPAFTFGGEDD